MVKMQMLAPNVQMVLLNPGGLNEKKGEVMIKMIKCH